MGTPRPAGACPGSIICLLFRFHPPPHELALPSKQVKSASKKNIPLMYSRDTSTISYHIITYSYTTCSTWPNPTRTISKRQNLVVQIIICGVVALHANAMASTATTCTGPCSRAAARCLCVVVGSSIQWLTFLVRRFAQQCRPALAISLHSRCLASTLLRHCHYVLLDGD